MEISKEHRKQIEQIVKSMDCPRDLACYKSGFKALPASKLIAGGKLVECLEPKPGCRFRLPFGYSTICLCPLNAYIAKNLKV